MKERIRFIINPRSGTGSKAELPDLIRHTLNSARFEPEIVFTQAPGHARELAREAAGQGTKIVVAVGGDGSVNETASGLVGSDTAIAILPCGSGNGLARHLHLPLELKKAIHAIDTSGVIAIDTFTVNDHFAAGTFGIGFDAHIAHLFSKAPKRGYSTYVKLVLSEFSSFHPVPIQFTVDGHHHQRDCFLLTFANSSQFGNNAVIAPFADLQDGWLDITMMRKFPFYAAPHLIYRLTHNTLHQSKFYDMMRGREIDIRNSGELQGHIDGEPVTLQGDIRIRLHAGSLRVIAPSTTA